MTALAVTGMIAIGNAVITALADIAMGLGAFFMLIAFVFAVAYLLTWRDARKHALKVVGAPPVPAGPEVIDDALPLFFEKREKRLRVVIDGDGNFYDD